MILLWSKAQGGKTEIEPLGTLIDLLWSLMSG